MARPQCAYEKLEDDRFISLEAYQDAGKPRLERSRIRTGCWEGNSYFILDGWDRQIASKEAVLNIRLSGQNPEEGISSLVGWSIPNHLKFVRANIGDETNILKFLQDAEIQQRDVTLEVSGGPTAVTAHFDVTGFSTNFQRLTCSN